jgi:NAD(P)-dependent dehydrogenase (short-subunit alcohol dehydrogenase family)
MNHQPLRYKVAIVTGAGFSVRRAVATRLAELGAFVVINDTDEKALNQTSVAIQTLGYEASCCSWQRQCAPYC